jgi:hypothetical protein
MPRDLGCRRVAEEMIVVDIIYNRNRTPPIYAFNK